MPKHVFFDLDTTLTPSRTRMKAEHVALFEKLCNQRDVVVVSGAQESQMRNQMPEHSSARYFMLTQNGNHALDQEGSLLWSETFTKEQTTTIMSIIEKWKSELAIAVQNENDLVENRGSQISYSLIGHEENRAKKASYDPEGIQRKKILADRQTDVDALQNVGVEVTVAGTTCFDFFLLGKNKGFHVARLYQRMNWLREECIYVGDALEPGRNDESVIGVIPTHAVKNPDETFDFITKTLLS